MNFRKISFVRNVVAAGLFSLLPFASNAFASNEICPAVVQIVATPITAERGFTYAAVSIRSGWKGENPYARESYLDKVVFAAAAIRETTDNGKPVFFVACDYEGAGEAGIRMSQRFPVMAKPVGDAWKDNYCTTGLNECAFKFD